MTATARFALPLLAPGQAQKEVFHNEAIAALDAALHACIEEGPRPTPPFSFSAGESWIIAADATGAWTGQSDSLATWSEGGWRFIVPVAGMTIWNKAAECWLFWSGSSWIEDSWPVASLSVAGDQVVGPRQPDVPSPSGGTTIDTQARAAIDALIATLKSHGLID